MYRVELKDVSLVVLQNVPPLFLMYRVELKVSRHQSQAVSIFSVPNVPCGFERRKHIAVGLGVFAQFLMYRVELKGKPFHKWA